MAERRPNYEQRYCAFNQQINIRVDTNDTAAALYAKRIFHPRNRNTCFARPAIGGTRTVGQAFSVSPPRCIQRQFVTLVAAA